MKQHSSRQARIAMRLIRPLFALAMTAICLGLGTGSAQAEPAWSIESFTAKAHAPNEPAGPDITQAGAHPDVTTSFEVSGQVNGSTTDPVEGFRDAVVDVPPGLVGNPTATPTCSFAALMDLAGMGAGLCPDASQVGVLNLKDAHDPSGTSFGLTAPIYNLDRPDNAPAMFGANVLSTAVTFLATVRPDGHYALQVGSFGANTALGVLGATVTLWGVPQDKSHDEERGFKCIAFKAFGIPCSNSSGDPRKPFISSPTECTGEPVSTTIHINTWQHPGEYQSKSAQSPALTGCELLPFNPSITVRPTSDEADSPTGLDVDLKLPQTYEDPEGLATALLKHAVVTLPEGMAVAPGAADGLGACSPSQIALGTNQEVRCPESSKIGSAEVVTPLLSERLKGDVYLAKQKENPFGSLLALYLVIRGPGLLIKLPGEVKADPRTGQLTASFDENPELPFEELRLHFNGGPRATLVNPPTCGTKTTSASFTSWAQQQSPVAVSDSFQITSGPGGGPCPTTNDLKPKLNAGVENPVGGASSTFNLQVSREDGSQQFSSLDVSLPEGLTAKLAGVPYCSEQALASFPSPAVAGTGAAELANPKCPAASQVGTATVGAGAGSNPFYVKTGKVYLAGPYKGQPLSLAIVTPAVAGPFDLGSVLVRSAIHVDPETAKISVASDPIPTILEGIPLDIRDVRVSVNKQGFAQNPTNCDPMAVDATVHGTEGATASLSNRFQLGSCEALGFKPKLALKLTGPTKRGQNPKLQAVLTQPQGQANIAKVSVALPHSEFLDQSHIKTICTRVQFAAKQCPQDSIYGYARAFTPLLEKPLEGPVYLRSSNHPLPDLVASLSGQVQIDLVGRIDSKNGGIRTSFETVPDAPVSKFVLTMQGGRKSLLVNSRDICRSSVRATVQIDAQNGKAGDQRPMLGSQCGGKAKRGK